jgi:hypothetical protein
MRTRIHEFQRRNPWNKDQGRGNQEALVCKKIYIYYINEKLWYIKKYIYIIYEDLFGATSYIRIALV